MREKLNSNPLAQVFMIGFLLVAVGVFVMSSMGGGGEEEEPATTTTSTTVTTTVTTGGAATPAEAMSAALSLVNGIASDAPPLPRKVRTALRSGQLVVIILVRGGNDLEDYSDYSDRDAARVGCCHSPGSSNPRIDSRLLRRSLQRMNVALFVAGAQYAYRYATITIPLGVDRVPALIVVNPRKSGGVGLMQASVHYGFQSPESVVQAVVDAGYRGRTLDYHP